jgi:tetraacyldisaccharide 4'-kinase
MNINNLWYKHNFISIILLPFSFIYRFIVFIRRLLYQFKIFKSIRISVPVIVVGNITVGGTGKTPLVIALVKALQENGFHPGIITRGYGGKNKIWPQKITENSDPVLVGDEAVLLAKKTKVPVFAGPNRVSTALLLLQTNQCNVIVSDDGLQHYALARDIEIAVIDSMRRLGNGFCLPAGPLREPPKRLKAVDFVVSNGVALVGEYKMQFVIDEICSLQDKSILTNNHSYLNIIAIAGIGNPERFFNSLRSLNIIFTSRIFPDHYPFQKTDFDFLNKDDIVIMTEKDAVKCAAFSDNRFYVARGHAELDPEFVLSVVSSLK